MSNLKFFSCLSFTLLLLLIACNQPHKVKYSDTFINNISIDGSSTVYPLSAAIVNEYLKEKSLVTIKLTESSTGAGFSRFIKSETDINDASRQINQSETEACETNGVKYLEFKVAYDAIVIATNPKNYWAKDINVNELRKIWESASANKITKWNQIRAYWPDKEIHLYGPDSTSGTYDYFTNAILGKGYKIRNDYQASRDHNDIASNIESDELALGYLGVAYYENHRQKLNPLAVDDLNSSNGKGPVLPTIDNIRNKQYKPLARPLYIYINSKSLNNNALRSFVSFYITNCSRVAYENGYIPLDASDYDASRKTWKVFLRKYGKDDLKGFPGSS